MRTTLDLPKNLIDEVMRITNSRTKSEAIRRALEEVIRKEQRMQLLTLKGKVDLQIDLETLRARDGSFS